ncbi:MAG: BglG family transcription antiterminator [Vagococcus fluvialis]|uniref:BglG family transcription antiterminator n=1 Tax=Vagococcus fluvialis TaxID=2738 RepID=UPI000A34899B|nr:PTS sugar transporter subunit IIA [Vagococcus fluvialis]MBO0420426.1 PTS sugar transporter subunit IIA [Vagococcus fluvialis]OTP31710.1 hypothetical protein A5798_001733 [Enterococcus sp. 6C8_DIV0013]
MRISERSKIIVNEIIKNKSITMEELSKKINLTRRQIEYSLDLANDYLKEIDHPEIERKKGVYVVDDSVKKLFNTNYSQNLKEVYVSESIDRAYFLFLMLVTRDDDFSINYFIDEFKVSKNTVVNDLKKTREILEKNNLDLEYSRKTGYQVVGDEWDIRNMIIIAINHVMNHFPNQEYLKHFMDISEEEWLSINHGIAEIEESLSTKFVDPIINHLPYIFFGIIARIELGNEISGVFFIDYEELSDTLEFKLVQHLLGEKEVGEEEQTYLTIHLLSTRVSLVDKSRPKDLPELKVALEEFVDEFEKNGFTKIINKDELINKLFTHLKPAYYRIKYDLTTDYQMIPKIDSDFKYIKILVKKSLEPLLKFLNTNISEIEISLISIIIGGHFIEHQQLNAQFRAIIVCQNGLAFSNLLKKSLIDGFSDFFFYEPMSIQEYNQFEEEYDVVFTACFLETSSLSFYLPEIPTKKELIRLRTNVLAALYKIDNTDVSIDDVIDIAVSNASQVDVFEMKKELVALLTPTVVAPKEEAKVKGKKSLANLLDVKFIKKISKEMDWITIINEVSEPLLRERLIDQGYINNVLNDHRELTSSIVLRQRIAIPHSSPTEGSKLGMSMLILDKPFFYNETESVRIIVMISSPDKQSHFKSLLQLLELSESNELYEFVLNNSEQEIQEKLLTYEFKN